MPPHYKVAPALIAAHSRAHFDEMKPLKKKLKIPDHKIQQLIRDMGGCFASDRITVDGLKVGYMYRELPDESLLSGWTFMAGDESQAYADNPDHWAIYDVNTICNYDPSIIPFLDAVYGTAYGREEGEDDFEEEPFE
jgi:hypothetical protein